MTPILSRFLPPLLFGRYGIIRDVIQNHLMQVRRASLGVGCFVSEMRCGRRSSKGRLGVFHDCVFAIFFSRTNERMWSSCSARCDGVLRCGLLCVADAAGRDLVGVLVPTQVAPSLLVFCLHHMILTVVRFAPYVVVDALLLYV